MNKEFKHWLKDQLYGFYHFNGKMYLCCSAKNGKRAWGWNYLTSYKKTHNI